MLTGGILLGLEIVLGWFLMGAGFWISTYFTLIGRSASESLGFTIIKDCKIIPKLSADKEFNNP